MTEIKPRQSGCIQEALLGSGKHVANIHWLNIACAKLKVGLIPFTRDVLMGKICNPKFKNSTSKGFTEDKAGFETVK